MNEISTKHLIVRFTQHQKLLLDRLLEHQTQWRTLNDLILSAVNEFVDQHIDKRADETDGQVT